MVMLFCFYFFLQLLHSLQGRLLGKRTGHKGGEKKKKKVFRRDERERGKKEKCQRCEKSFPRQGMDAEAVFVNSTGLLLGTEEDLEDSNMFCGNHCLRINSVSVVHYLPCIGSYLDCLQEK